MNALPIYLNLFKEFNLKATFFLVGKDLENDSNVKLLKKILDDGHEVANHGYLHNGFDTFSNKEKFDDIRKSHDIIKLKLNTECHGFKAPCYALDVSVIKMLMKIGYEYDSSMISTVISGMMKMYYRFIVRQKMHPSNWGYFSHLFAPSAPYHPDQRYIWRKGKEDILEMPVTTLPFLKIPIHFSFINVIGFKLFFFYKLFTYISPTSFLNYSFHAVDLLPHNVLPKSFYYRPGLKRTLQWRLDRAKWILEEIMKRYTIQTSFSISQKYRKLL